MKKLFSILLACLLALGIAGAGCRLGGTTVAITESHYVYEFSATFNKKKTGEIQQYINQSVRPDNIFESSRDRVNITTTLQDHTKFQVKASPGELRIRMNKEENTPESVERIKKMCEEIKTIIGR